MNVILQNSQINGIRLWRVCNFCIETVIQALTSLSVKGVRTGLPKMCHFGMWTILSWRQLRPCGLKWNIYLSVKEFKLRALPIIRVITKNNLSRPIYSEGHASNYWTSALLIVQQMTSLPVSPRVPVLVLSSECHTYSSSLSVSGPLVHVGSLILVGGGSHTCTCN